MTAINELPESLHRLFDWKALRSNSGNLTRHTYPYYKDSMILHQEPAWLKLITDAYRAEWLRTELNEEEQATASNGLVQYYGSAIHEWHNQEALSMLGIYDDAKAANILLELKVGRRHADLAVEQADFYGAYSYLFEDKPEPQMTTDLYRAAVLKWVANKEYYRPLFIQAARAKYCQPDSQDLTSLEDHYRPMFERIGLWDEVWKYHVIRYEKKLREKHPNDEETVRALMWEKTKPDGHKRADRLRDACRPAPGSLSKARIKMILSIETSGQLDQKNREGLLGRDGLTLSELDVLLVDDSRQTLFEVNTWYAGGDDADDWSHLFDNLEAARAMYQTYLQPLTPPC
jgi:hypothetical protein